MTSTPQRVDGKAFREAIAHFATGVAVITTSHEEKPAGMTANSLSSLSLDPALLLVCIQKNLSTHSAIEATGRFAVNILGEGQIGLALRFGGPSPDKFAGVALDDRGRVPVLNDAIAHFLCDLHECVSGGDHSIFIGAVRECSYKPEQPPLIYYRNKFRSMGPRAPLYPNDDGWSIAPLGAIPPLHLGTKHGLTAEQCHFPDREPRD